MGRRLVVAVGFVWLPRRAHWVRILTVSFAVVVIARGVFVVAQREPPLFQVLNVVDCVLIVVVTVLLFLPESNRFFRKEPRPA